MHHKVIFRLLINAFNNENFGKTHKYNLVVVFNYIQIVCIDKQRILKIGKNCFYFRIMVLLFLYNFISTITGSLINFLLIIFYAL